MSAKTTTYSTNLTTSENNNCRILVTGASGYLAMHCIQQLLQQGYKVRGTLRDLNCTEKVIPLRQLANSDQLELFHVTLEDGTDLWEKVMMDCTYVLHIASPCDVIADETFVEIAVRGTLNVLGAAARQKCIRKIVLTSSSVGHNNSKKVFTENDWTNLNWKHLHSYHRSKTLAEKTAWDFMEQNPNMSFSLTVLNPSLIIGPSLQNAKGASVTIISRFLDGSMPAYPAIKFGLVDVRDVARAHILAMKDSKSNGERIIITSETLSFQEIASILRKEFAGKGYRIPRHKVPYAVLWLYSFIDKAASKALLFYGHEDKFDNSKAFQLLGIESYQDVKKTLIEMAYDMIERNILPRQKVREK